MMIEPALTAWPPWRLTPRRFPALSRPFFPAPPAFLWAMAYSLVAFFFGGAGFLTALGLAGAFFAASFLAGLALAGALAGSGSGAGAGFGLGAGAGFSTGASFSSAKSLAVIRLRSAAIRVIRTLVSAWRWPWVRRYCFLLFFLKTMTFSSR